MSKPLGVIHLDVYHLQVAVFTTDKARIKNMRKNGVSNPLQSDNACFASAHLDTGDDGRSWFSMIIKPEATKATWAHECVHIADFVMDRLGIPSGAENTEVRAYMVGHLFASLEALCVATE